LSLTGPDGLLKQLTKTVLETALNQELTEHLGHEKHGQPAWEQFIPFPDYDLGIRTVLCSTNAIESLNARYRRAIKARGHFPTEQAALKCLYLVTRSLDPTGTGRTWWAIRWKPALNALAIQTTTPATSRPPRRTAHRLPSKRSDKSRLQ
jgi:transposase-like protein